ncbi:ACT domain-containing protein [Pseudoxanthomonas daejeonensis]|uniref:ACT domain-containing protein n=1 Tax=Pseudoxanthomonas daejeonensis TaxID=266062 RepID=UPI0030CEB231
MRPGNELQVLLAHMRPELEPGRYAFVALPPGTGLDPAHVVASIREPEGLSVVVEERIARELGLQVAFTAAWITLRVQSDLAAVGFTAAFSRALGQAGISCNVVAGVRHDHLFVPFDQARQALDALDDLSRSAGAANRVEPFRPHRADRDPDAGAHQELRQEPAMDRVTGLGGIFFRARDPEALRAWYRTHLGIDVQSWGGTAFRWVDGNDVPIGGTTVWSIGGGESFAPGTASFMVNYRVADLDGLLALLREEGCEVIDASGPSEFGKFGWVLDPEGNKIELWQPPEGR